MKISADNVSVAYGEGPMIVHDMSLNAQPGEVTTFLGPNGCGKSTFLKALSRLLTPTKGSVEIDGQPLHQLSAREAATRVALLPQHPVCPEGLTVGELVERGRHPHRKYWWSAGSASDNETIGKALERTDTAHLARRKVAELSGGQRQRVWMAMVLAQNTPVVLLDEPTTFLDPAHAIEILELARGLAADGKTVITVLHDLMLAGQYSDRLVVMKGGRQIVTGSPTEALTSSVLQEAYGLNAEVWEDPRGNSPVIVPRGTLSQS
ncbi:ABC transporter ATP-binding protein [Corynebacterium sp. ED61]|uniref:ABC transporter ATP-binding protein n=1 Tax=Corynebacterium sp. ED61 TaxID=2211360 RepID=UPI001883D59C|nr:ABC transporter ATP-binding protein [Corynebacterium sp. ED61]MBF0581438.1 ABC transporter ATP-binding protein [Corynebacterium sp. ED61]